MAEKQIFPGDYEREKDMSLVPQIEWLTLRTETTTNKKGVVTISLFMKRATETKWTLLLKGLDTGTNFDSPPLVGSHPLGIRTDFMDVEFDNFMAEKL